MKYKLFYISYNWKGYICYSIKLCNILLRDNSSFDIENKVNIVNCKLLE